MPSRIRYICGGTGPPRLLSYHIGCRHVAGNVLLGKCGACGRFGLHIILYIHVVAGTVCFSAVYGLDTCQVVNTFCRMVSLRLGLGCFYRSSSAPLIRPSQTFQSMPQARCLYCPGIGHQQAHGLAPSGCLGVCTRGPRLLLTNAKLR